MNNIADHIEYTNNLIDTYTNHHDHEIMTRKGSYTRVGMTHPQTEQKWRAGFRDGALHNTSIISISMNMNPIKTNKWSQKGLRIR
jgi:hypothetical protein